MPDEEDKYILTDPFSWHLSIKFAKDVANRYENSWEYCEKFQNGEIVQLERELSPSRPWFHKARR